MSYNNSSAWPEDDHELPLQIFWTVLGFAGTLTNFFVICTIFKTKELHNKSQFAILSHAVAEFLFEAVTCIIGVRGCIAYAWSARATKQYQCMLLMLPLHITGAAEMAATMLLGIDRLLAVKAPIFYKKMTTSRYMLIFNVIAWGYALVNLIEVSALTAPFVHEEPVPLCVFVVSSLTPLNQYVNNISAGVLSLLTIVIYVAALISVGYRYWCRKWLNEAQRSEWARNVQLEAFKTIMILGCIYFCCWAMGIAMFMISDILQSREGILLKFYGGLLFHVNYITHLFVYLKRNRRFRDGFACVVLRKTATSVVTLHTDAQL